MSIGHFRITALLLASAVVTAGADSVLAQTGVPAGPQGDTIDSIKLLPDLNGVWEPLVKPTPKDEYAMKPALTPAWSKRFDELKKLADADKPVPSRTLDCINRGLPGGMRDPEALIEFYYSPGRVTIVDTTGWVRRIYTDGRKHSDLVDTFWGDSVGHWENGTLVVDTQSLDANNEFIVGLNQGAGSDVAERISLKGPNTLSVDTTLDAPKALTAPMRYTLEFRRHRDWMMTEFDCVFDNLDTNRAILR